MNRQQSGRLRRHRRIRKRVVGYGERPRLCVFRSHKHLYAQIVDDFKGQVLLGVSTLVAGKQQTSGGGGNLKAAVRLGQRVAEAARARGITKVAFDRGGYIYHGRIKALADAAREGGLEF